MDYQIGLYLKGLIVLIILNLSYCQIERDLILTPKLSLHINGRTLYYKPTTSIIDPNKTTSFVPWEQTLKHVTFLTLHSNLETDTTDNLNNFVNYKRFMNSSYIPVASYIPKFGDIITLARGRLEKLSNNDYRFVEGQCKNQCDLNNVLAYWQVQKIRHRDLDRKFRYEIKFSVNPKDYNENNNSNSDSYGDGGGGGDEKIEPNGKREINLNLNLNSGMNRIARNSRTLRSFILKDNDYPKSFNYLDDHIAKRRHDQEQNVYLDRLNAFNEIFTPPKYFSGISRSSNIVGEFNSQEKKLPQLNIGEYIVAPQRILSQSRNGLPTTYIRNYPTTYRPNYHGQFEKPYSLDNNPYYNNFQPAAIRYPGNEEVQPLPLTSLDQNVNKKLPITTHLHHHYYVKNKNINNPNNQAERPELLNNHKDEQNDYYNDGEYNKDHRGTIELIEQPLNTPSSVPNQISIPPQQQHQQQHLEQQKQRYHQQQYQQQQQHQNQLQQQQYQQQHQLIFNPPKQILATPPLYYMQSIPISPQLPLYLYDPNNFHHPNEVFNNYDQARRPPLPFRESDQVVNKIHYSEPDPLYKNVRVQNQDILDPRHIFTSAEPEITETISHDSINLESSPENNNKEQYGKPDSINSQLPPPDDDQDLRVPYIENSATETSSVSESSSHIISQKQIEQPTSSISPSITTTLTYLPQTVNIRPTLKKSEPTILKSEEFSSSTTSRLLTSPTIKILTNEPPFNEAINFIHFPTDNNTEINAQKFVKISTTVKPKLILPERTETNISANKSIITVTKRNYHRSTTERPVLKWKPKRGKVVKETKPTVKTSKIEFERVPVNVTERVFTVTPSKINEIPTKKSVSASVSVKIGKDNKEKPFSPKVFIPNVEVYEANLVKVNTSDKGIKFFKAFSSRDDSEKKISDKDEMELTESIVQHVRSL